MVIIYSSSISLNFVFKNDKFYSRKYVMQNI